jgi:GNAT superfamily N-acetyltransferase
MIGPAQRGRCSHARPPWTLPDGSRVLHGELVVAEAMERRGIGARLLGAAEAWAVERGLERLTLETGAANSGARAFYAAAGYVEEDVRLTKEISG